MHFNYRGEAYQAARPKLDIRHHINNLFFKKGGYSLKLSGGELIEDRQSGFEVNDWLDLVIELREEKLLIELNRHQRILEHEQVSMKTRDEFTFKELDGPSSRLVIDFVRLWRAEWFRPVFFNSWANRLYASRPLVLSALEISGKQSIEMWLIMLGRISKVKDLPRQVMDTH